MSFNRRSLPSDNLPRDPSQPLITVRDLTQYEGTYRRQTFSVKVTVKDPIDDALVYSDSKSLKGATTLVDIQAATRDQKSLEALKQALFEDSQENLHVLFVSGGCDLPVVWNRYTTLPGVGASDIYVRTAPMTAGSLSPEALTGSDALDEEFDFLPDVKWKIAMEHYRCQRRGSSTGPTDDWEHLDGSCTFLVPAKQPSTYPTVILQEVSRPTPHSSRESCSEFDARLIYYQRLDEIVEGQDVLPVRSKE